MKLLLLWHLMVSFFKDNHLKFVDLEIINQWPVVIYPMPVYPVGFDEPFTLLRMKSSNLGLVSTVVADSPFKIFIGGLPNYLTDDQVSGVFYYSFELLFALPMDLRWYSGSSRTTKKTSFVSPFRDSFSMNIWKRLNISIEENCEMFFIRDGPERLPSSEEKESWYFILLF